jgi:hypothetical protein
MKRNLKYSMPQTEGEKVSFNINVCWKCGQGSPEHVTLYNNGKSGDGHTVYACAAHRGLLPQATTYYG